MNGGSMTTLSRISMAAAAALLVGLSPATAADLGGNCCADLEERVAELEATTARKGTRNVTLTISGQISQQLLFWDDGNTSDVYVNGPGTSNTRWRFLGSARISPMVTAGFLYELEAYASNNTVDQSNGGDDRGSRTATLREAMAWVEHSGLGRVSIGHGSTAANNAILVDLSGKAMGSSNYVALHSNGMRLFSRDLFNDTGNGYLNAGTWGSVIEGGSGDWLNERVEHIQYRTPTIAGFTLGASWGEDDYWDAALRYAGEFNGVRIAGALGYSVRAEYDGAAEAFTCTTQCDKKLEQLAGSLSIRHMPTGLFFTGAAGWRDMKRQDAVAAGTTFPVAETDDEDGVVGIQQGANRSNFESSFFYLSGGVARNFFGIGDTVLFGEYSQYKGVGQDVEFQGVIPQALTFTQTNDVQIHTFGGANTKMTHWGIGIVQHVDAASMEFWLAYKNYSLSGLELQTLIRPNLGKFEDLHLIQAGTRIRF